MLYLQATRKAIVALGLDPNGLGPADDESLPIDNWVVNLIDAGKRQAYLFMNCRTLLSFPIMIGEKVPGPEDMPSFLSHGINQLAAWLRLSAESTKILNRGSDRIALCRNEDKSTLGLIRSLGTDYQFRTKPGDEFDSARLGEIIIAVNSTPRAKLAYKTSVETTREVLSASAA